MKRHAKALSAGSISGQAGHFGSKLLLTCATAIFAALVLGVSLAAAIAPTVSIENASEVTATTAKAEGTIDPQDHEAFYGFEYATQADFSDAASFGTGGHLAEGSGPQQVSTTATQLGPNETYYLRLVATNEDGVSTAVAASTFTTDAIAPTVGNPGHTQLARGEVIIAGAVNSHNSAVSDCHFEYGPDDSYGQGIPCEALPPTSNKSSVARAKLTGLTPGATYHFKLSVTNGVGTAESADAAFVARAASSQPACSNAGSIGVGFLPNCRAWEMVSPQDKNGGNLISSADRTRVAAGGSAAQFYSLTGFAGAEGMGIAAEYIARRSTDPSPGNQGWGTHPIIPPQEQNTVFTTAGEPRYQGEFSADFTKGVFLANSPLGDEGPQVAGSPNLYRRDDLLKAGPGHYELLSDCLAPPAGPCAESTVSSPLSYSFKVPIVAGTSADFAHVLFESQLQLNSESPPSGEVRLYDASGGQPQLAGVLPDGSAAAQSVAGRGGVSVRRLSLHPISTDGSRISFTDPTTGRLYARINGRSTVQLNAAERSTPDSEAPATYLDASEDGHRVFFTSREALTEDAPASSPKLYMWKLADEDEQQSVTVDATGGTFTLSFNGNTTTPLAYNASAQEVEEALEALVSVKQGNLSVTGASGSYLITFTGDFAGANVAEISADGSVLSGGASTANVSMTQGVENLTYLSVDAEPADGEPGDVMLGIGTSSTGSRVYFLADSQLVAGGPKVKSESGIEPALYIWNEGEIRFIGQIHAFNAPDFVEDPEATRVNQAYVNSVGDLVFTSRSGVDLLSAHGGTDYDHNPGACRFGSGCKELYVYSADSAELQCASCSPSGAPATTDAENHFFDDEGHGGSVAVPTRPRVLSEDGRYTFFSTAERLVAEDTNGVSDAYVFDIQESKVSLLSSGESPDPSYFMNASADGRNAFFTTTQRLSGWDNDGNVDLYDARVGGGFPEPPPPPPSCQGDACQPPPLNLVDPTPASASFSGSGNQASHRKRVRRCSHGKRAAAKRQRKARCAGHGKRRAEKKATNDKGARR